MTKVIFGLLLCLSAYAGDAQMPERDSLRQLLQSEQTDTTRVMRLADLSFTYLESKPDTTMLLALEALSLARKISFARGEAESLNRVGKCLPGLRQ